MEERFMREAIEEALLSAKDGEIPVGAVIVKDGQIVGRGRNCAEKMHDPTCHAEMMAIKNACENLGVWRLTGCEMYVTLEPCHMCAGAIVLSRLSALYIGTKDPKAGACGSLNSITTDKRLNHNVEPVYGLLQEECSQILKDFFKELRKRPKNKSEEKQ